MKADIHPKYYPNARIVCACGNTWTTGATLPEIHLDLCSNCHPFYTGEQRIVDTAGRVDRFKMRLAQKRDIVKKEKTRKEKFVIVTEEAPAPTT
jgi:large subunit ribosomal protein L31